MKNKIVLVLLVLVSLLCIGGCVLDTSLNTEYTIKVVENDNCDISLSKTTAKKNDEIEVIVENIKDGYVMDKITANGFKIDDNKFIMPAENVTVVVFLKNEATPTMYDVESIANENCSISLSKSKAGLGDMVEVEISNITEGYEVNNIKVNGFIIEGYTFEMPASDVVVEVSLKEIEYVPTNKFNITLVQNDKCSVLVSKDTASKNEEVNVTVTNILAGYKLLKVKVNGFAIEGNTFKMPSCNVVVEAVIVLDKEYSVEVVASEYAKITLSKNKYSVGETVSIDYMCKGYYVLDKFYVDGAAIEGTSFEMPNRDVVITGSFVNVIADTEWCFSVTSGGTAGRYYAYFTYGETGINVRVIADDSYVFGPECATNPDYQNNPAYQDNIEVILSPKSNTAGYDVNKTYKFLVSSTNTGYIQVASSTTAWKTITLNSNQYTQSVVRKYYDNKDGYDGYEVNFFVSYDVFGLTKNQAVGNMTACVATRNVNSYQKSEWAPGTWSCYNKNGCAFSNISTHPIINSDGSLGERS